MPRHLAQIYIMWVSYPNKDTLLFDDESSGALRHVKLHPQAETSHIHSFGQTLCIPIGSVFGANVSLQNWEVFLQSHWKKSEHFQYSPDLPVIVQKYSALTDLIKLPKDNDK